MSDTPNGRGERKRILVVDDDELVRVTAKTILEREGYFVKLASNGVQALEQAAQMSLDVMILDIIMPEKEGIETLLQIKREFPSVKVIAISSGGRKGVDDFLMIADRFGADAALKKPIRPKALLAQVSRLLNESSAPAQSAYNAS
jgi:CheY-like chemotaxis protein